MMNRQRIARELVAVVRELTASDYSKLDPRKVTTLAESIAEGVLGWPKVADALADGYEFVLTRLSDPDKRLEKVKGLTKFDVMKIYSQTYATSSVSVIKGRGQRKRELDKELKNSVRSE